jgi:hypothetical protein
MAIAFDLSKTTQSARPVRYKIHDHARVNAPDHPSGLLDIWIPVIPETPYQRVLDIEITAPGPWQMHRESEFGNLLFHCRTALSTPSAIETHFRYLVERLPLTHDLDPARVGPVSARQLFARVLAEERFVDVNDKTRALARDIVRGERTPSCKRVSSTTTSPPQWLTTRPSSPGKAARSTLWFVPSATATTSTPCSFRWLAPWGTGAARPRASIRATSAWTGSL